MSEFIISELGLWLIIVVALVVVELSSFNLTAIWFAFGSLVAFFASLLGVPFAGQIIIAIVFSAASLLLLRPFTKRFFKPKANTNVDRLIGTEGVVTVTIDAVQATGQVKIGSGQIWSAKAADVNMIIEEKTLIKVEAIEGVKLVVSPLNS